MDRKSPNFSSSGESNTQTLLTLGTVILLLALCGSAFAFTQLWKKTGDAEKDLTSQEETLAEFNKRLEESEKAILGETTANEDNNEDGVIDEKDIIEDEEEGDKTNNEEFINQYFTTNYLNLADNSVSTNIIQDGQVLYNDLGLDVIDGSKIIDNSITYIDIFDGAGSNLDSDMLDGHDSSYFMPKDTDLWVDEDGDTMTDDLIMTEEADIIARGVLYNDSTNCFGSLISVTTALETISCPVVIDDNLLVTGNSEIFGDETVYGKLYANDDVFLGDGNEDRVTIFGPISSGDGQAVTVQDNHGLLVTKRNNPSTYLFSVDGTGLAIFYNDAVPKENLQYSLGLSDKRWLNIYAGDIYSDCYNTTNGSHYCDNAYITGTLEVNGNTDLNSDLNVDGNATVNGTGVIHGVFTVNDNTFLNGNLVVSNPSATTVVRFGDNSVTGNELTFRSADWGNALQSDGNLTISTLNNEHILLNPGNGEIRVFSDVVPNYGGSESYDIGKSDRKFDNVYANFFNGNVLGCLTTLGGSSYCDSAYVTGSLEVLGDVNLRSNATVDGDFNALSNVKLGDASTDSIELQGTIQNSSTTNGGQVFVNDRLVVTNTIGSGESNPLIIKDEEGLFVETYTASTPLLHVNGTTGNTTVFGGLEVLGNGHFYNDLTVDGMIYGDVTGNVYTSLGEGSVAFEDSFGKLTGDNANLFFDDANNRLGIGTSTPQEELDVNGEIALEGMKILEKVTTTNDKLYFGGTGIDEYHFESNGGNFVIGNSSTNRVFAGRPADGFLIYRANNQYLSFMNNSASGRGYNLRVEDGDFIIQTHDNFNQASQAVRFVIDNQTGNVLIGDGYGTSGLTIDQNGNLAMNGNLTVDGSATFGGGYSDSGVTIEQDGDVLMNGKLTVDGSIDPTDIVLTPKNDGDIAIDVKETGGTSVFTVNENGEVNIADDLNVQGEIITNGNMTINAQLTVNDLIVTGNANISRVNNDLIPLVNNVYNLGTTTNRWANLFVTAIELNGQDLSTLIANISTDIGTLRTDVNNLRTDVNTLRADVDLLRTDVDTLRVDVDALTGRITTVEGDILDHETRISTIENSSYEGYLVCAGNAFLANPVNCVITAPAGRTFKSITAVPVGTGTGLSIQFVSNPSGLSSVNVRIYSNIPAVGQPVNGIMYSATLN